jgi:D-aspartate ligase
MTPVVVLSLGEGPLSHVTLAVIRTFGRMGVPVHLLTMTDPTIVRRSRYLLAVRRLPPDHEGALEVLLAYRGGFDEDPVLVAIGDMAALFVDQFHEAIREKFVFPRVPGGVPALLADKHQLSRVCVRHDLAAPRTCLPDDFAAARSFAADVGYPIMVKAADARLIDWERGDKSVLRSDDEVSLCGLLTDRGELRGNLLLQEFVPGGDDVAWFFHGYFAEGGRRIAGYSGRKLREYPPGAGITTLAVYSPNDRVEAAVTDLIQAVGYAGIVDVDCRYDARSDEYLILDVNPRVGANFRLFVDRDGNDLVRCLYRDLRGETAPMDEPVPGRKWWLESYDVLTWTRYFGRGRSSWRALPSSLLGVRETGWFALDDLRPFLAMLRWRVRRLLEIGRNVT